MTGSTFKAARLEGTTMGFFMRQTKRVEAILQSDLTNDQKLGLIEGLLIDTHIMGAIEQTQLEEPTPVEVLIADGTTNAFVYKPGINRVPGLDFEGSATEEEVVDRLENLQDLIANEDVCRDCVDQAQEAYDTLCALHERVAVQAVEEDLVKRFGRENVIRCTAVQ